MSLQTWIQFIFISGHQSQIIYVAGYVDSSIFVPEAFVFNQAIKALIMHQNTANVRPSQAI